MTSKMGWGGERRNGGAKTYARALIGERVTRRTIFHAKRREKRFGYAAGSRKDRSGEKERKDI